jgi:hypothetical protein
MQYFSDVKLGAEWVEESLFLLLACVWIPEGQVNKTYEKIL